MIEKPSDDRSVTYYTILEVNQEERGTKCEGGASQKKMQLMRRGKSRNAIFYF